MHEYHRPLWSGFGDIRHSPHPPVVPVDVFGLSYNLIS